MVAEREAKSLDAQVAEIRTSIKKLFAMMAEVNQRVAILKGAITNLGVAQRGVPLDAAFDTAKPAPDHRTLMVRKMFAKARDVKYAEADLKKLIKTMWNLESTKDMTGEMIEVVLTMLSSKNPLKVKENKS
jgi:hypothetical protein